MELRRLAACLVILGKTCFGQVDPGTRLPSAAPSVPPAPEPVLVETFSGQGQSNTHPMTLKKGWMISWRAQGNLKVLAGHLDGTPDELILDLGTHRSGYPSQGDSFCLNGGIIYLKVTGDADWSVDVKQVQHIIGAPVGEIFIESQVAPSPTPVPVPLNVDPQELTKYLSGIVIVKGSNSTGTGFLIKLPVTGTKEIVGLLTNQHVIANNRSLTFQTVDGALLKATMLYGAPDRDLAFVQVEDNGELPTIDFPASVPNDNTMIPGNSQGAGVVTDTPGKIVAIGPQRQVGLSVWNSYTNNISRPVQIIGAE